MLGPQELGSRLPHPSRAGAVREGVSGPWRKGPQGRGGVVNLMRSIWWGHSSEPGKVVDTGGRSSHLGSFPGHTGKDRDRGAGLGSLSLPCLARFLTVFLALSQASAGPLGPEEAGNSSQGPAPLHGPHVLRPAMGWGRSLPAAPSRALPDDCAKGHAGHTLCPRRGMPWGCWIFRYIR